MTRVRPATLDDATAIAHIHVACWRHAYAGLMPAALLDALDEDARQRQWERMLAPGGEASSELVTLVSVDEQDVVTGFAQVGPVTGDPEASASCAPAMPDGDGVGVLHAIYLAPAAIGTGVGRELLEAATQALRELGLTRAVLDVLPGNVRARAVYERAGWHAVGEPWDVQHGEHVLPHQRYERPLT